MSTLIQELWPAVFVFGCLVVGQTLTFIANEYSRDRSRAEGW
jgi:hypothetical protein